MDAVKEFRWFLVILVGFWFLWFFTGGPERATSQTGIFLKPPAPLETGESYSSLSSFDGPIIMETGTKNGNGQPSSSFALSIFRNMISLHETGGARITEPQKEFIELRAGTRNLSATSITGWRVMNLSGKTVEISQGTTIPYLSRINIQSTITLSPGEKAIVATGRSPAGVSFKVNKCSGYFEQFQDFNPPLKKECPSPLTNVDTPSFGLEDACVNYIKNMPKCQINLEPLPADLSPRCSLFINSQINYNTCVDKHKNDSDFQEKEWRVFLGESTELWANNHETIKLFDQTGKIVDVLSY